MFRTIFFLLFFVLGCNISHAETACDRQLGKEMPSIRPNVTVLCRYAYIAAYDNIARIPMWVAYEVTPNTAIGCLPRLDRFLVDNALPTGARSYTRDFYDSGYDIGHLADASTMSWNSRAEYESFLLSNTAPQTPNFNRGIWKLLELKIRVWAYAGRSMRVYTGTIWDDASVKIGSGVTVPEKFYKVVVDIETDEAIAFLFDNEPHSSKNLSEFMVSVQDIENATGIKFPIIDKTTKSPLWAGDSKSLLMSKRKACVVK